MAEHVTASYTFDHRGSTWFVVQTMNDDVPLVTHVRFPDAQAAREWVIARQARGTISFDRKSPHDMFTYIPVG